MLKYFINIKFWMPLVLLMLITFLLEMFFRMGMWDNHIKPRSYLGNAIYREKAVTEFGLQNIHWITIGDSKTDWGIEHNKILDSQKKNGINHVRMSFESSNFMAIQSTIDWSIANMPNLKGIMIGITTENFYQKSNPDTQYKVAWPFRQYFNYKKYLYFDLDYKLFSYYSRSAMAVYFRDFKEYIQEFIRRNKQIKFNSGSEFKKILEFNRNMSEDVCQFQLNDLQQCVNSADKILNSKSRLTGTEQFIVNVCHNNVATHWLTHDKSKLKINSQLRVDVTRNWQKLFSHILKHKLKLKVIKLPEHKMFEYLLAPSDTDELISDILSKFEGNPNFEILDLTHVIKSKKESQQCKFFYDPLHYNNLSKSIITQKIIESFPVYSPQNNDAKADLIKKNHFE